MRGVREGGSDGREGKSGRTGNPKNLGHQLFANLYFSVLVTGILPVPMRSALFKMNRISRRYMDFSSPLEIGGVFSIPQTCYIHTFSVQLFCLSAVLSTRTNIYLGPTPLDSAHFQDFET